jgi:hypothetical protein
VWTASRQRSPESERNERIYQKTQEESLRRRHPTVSLRVIGMVPNPWFENSVRVSGKAIVGTAFRFAVRT